MSVEKMKRLDVLAHRSNADELSAVLLRLRCVDVEVTPLSDELLERYDCSEQIRAHERELERIESALAPLYRYSTRKKSLFRQKIALDIDEFAANPRYEDVKKLADESLNVTARMAEIDRELAALTARERAADAWTDYDLPLSFAGTERTRVILGALPTTVSTDTLEEKTADLAAAYRTVSADSLCRYLMFVAESGDADALIRRLGLLGFTRAEFPADCGRAEDVARACAEERKRLEEETASLELSLKKCASSLDELEALWDVEATRLREAQLRDRLASTRECVVLKGWIPEEKCEKASKVLSEFDCAFDLCEPAEGENVPVKLKNNPFASCFEWVVGMYSLPAYGTYDPTFIMAICYLVLFSLMFADAGYGLLLMLGGFLLPRALHIEGQTKKAFNMFGWCGVGSTVTGILFGGYFGDLPLAVIRAYMPGVEAPQTLALLVDPVLDPLTYLIIGLAVGFIHLVLGQGVQFVLLWKDNKKVDAICDIGLFWGLYLGLILLFAAPAVGKWVCIAFVAAIVLTGGRKEKNLLMRLPKGLLALYGLVNFGSDVISYSRILAIALSGTILAQVFNILGTMSTSPVFAIIGTPLILVIGHVLNLALSALSGFVHTSRLQYVEFFGKFYIDGGKPFAPMLPSDRFASKA